MTQNHRDRRISAVLALLDSEPSMGRTHQQLAANVNLSPSRLRHLVKHETGVALGEFVKSAKLERSRLLLRSSFLNIKQVTFQAGFRNEAHFIREFRKRFGVTPGQYRQQHG